MQKINGELINGEIVFTKPKDFGRIYSKSHFGKTVNCNKLIINLIEGVFLLEENKIKLFEKGTEIDFKYLVEKSILLIPNFEIKYIVFRDLRKKGYFVEIIEDNDDFNFKISKGNNKSSVEKNNFYISVLSERDILELNKINVLIKKAKNKNSNLWFSIVDEEGDITYYELTIINLKGKNFEKKYVKTKAILMDNRVLIFNEKLSKDLFKGEFYGKPFGPCLQISMVEALYLLKKDYIKIQNIRTSKNISFNLFKQIVEIKQPDINIIFNVYSDLKARGFIVKTGFKFGAHFRAYSKNPNELHAEYLIHVFNENFKSICSDFSRAIRLAHSVNKEIIFACYYDNDKIEYIKIGRLRP
jgi:tRNA-intron endonuclease